MKHLFTATLLALALSTTLAQAESLKLDCTGEDGSRMSLRPGSLGKSVVLIAVGGTTVKFTNVGGPMSELNEAKGFLGNNSDGFAVHAIFDFGLVMGNGKSMGGKAYGNLLTNDGRIISLEALNCSN